MNLSKIESKAVAMIREHGRLNYNDAGYYTPPGVDLRQIRNGGPLIGEKVIESLLLKGKISICRPSINSEVGKYIVLSPEPKK